MEVEIRLVKNFGKGIKFFYKTSFKNFKVQKKEIEKKRTVTAILDPYFSRCPHVV